MSVHTRVHTHTLTHTHTHTLTHTLTHTHTHTHTHTYTHKCMQTHTHKTHFDQVHAPHVFCSTLPPNITLLLNRVCGTRHSHANTHTHTLHIQRISAHLCIVVILRVELLALSVVAGCVKATLQGTIKTEQMHF